jgi:hypothetical protein
MKPVLYSGVLGLSVDQETVIFTEGLRGFP